MNLLEPETPENTEDKQENNSTEDQPDEPGDNSNQPEIPDNIGKVIQRNVEDEMKKSYLEYAMSVIIGRALPDVRDGLKPVHRRILYGMYESGMTSTKAYKKSARIVGDVMGKYHPHGDQAIYDTLVRMAQDFSLRYLLIDGQGNFGSVDGDSAAAMRYTESRLKKLSEELLSDIEKDTVDFVPNYDGSLKEPTVLPSKFPNLLVNGSAGIAVGMATRIPPHNLIEVINGLIALIENPDIDVIGLMEHIKGPDFPTGGIIHGRGGIVQAYTTGRGKVSVRAQTHLEEMKGGRERIIVDEIPYMVNKAELIKSIAELVKNKKIEGISDLRDESDREGMRMVIELKKGASSEIILNQLYKHTQMQDSFGIINLALVNNQPRVLTLREMLRYFLDHRLEVVERRTGFELKKAEKRAHIVEGILIALRGIDEVIKLIRGSKDTPTAKAALSERFGLSEAQSKAILEMRLQKLTSLETEGLRKEFEELKLAIDEFKQILGSRERMTSIIKEELVTIRDKYGDGRRTEILEYMGDLEVEDLIADEPVILTITKEGYIKRQAMDTYRSQKRGGKGVIGTRTREEDYVADIFTARTHDYLMLFTNHGRVYWLKVWRVPDAGRYSLGRALVNMLPALESGEKVYVIIPVREFDDRHFLVFATKRGVVKKTILSAFSHPRRIGVRAILLDEEDELVEVRLTTGENDIMLATRLGKAIRFHEGDVRGTGRASRGVIGIRLARGDEVMDMLTVSPEVVEEGEEAGEEENEEEENEEEEEVEEEIGEERKSVIPGDIPILTITELGYGKRSYLSRYRKQNRGGKGIYTIRITEKNGPLRCFKVGPDGYELMISTVEGMVIRTTTSDIRIMGRHAQGVKVIRLNEEDRVAGVTLFSSEIDENNKENGEKVSDGGGEGKERGIEEKFNKELEEKGEEEEREEGEDKGIEENMREEGGEKEKGEESNKELEEKSEEEEKEEGEDRGIGENTREKEGEEEFNKELE
ncbi:MAG: DNA gyrase subunit A, partial [Thermoplasmata archaeon]|nr:DNA gyrase subunit A [Thermoplasmata archaeon]